MGIGSAKPKPAKLPLVNGTRKAGARPRSSPFQGPAEITLPMPPEREWKSALSRFR